MKELPEQIFDEAISALLDGKSIEQLSQQYPEYQQELLGLLPMVQLLAETPKNDIPTPTRHYRFAEKQTSWQKLANLFVLYRPITIPAFVVVILLSGGLLANATNSSLPGDKLFPLRIAGEKTRLSLTFNQEKVANLHVELAHNRLDDVKKAMENSDPEQEAAAISALTEQTEVTLAAVSRIAADQAISNKDTTLLDNLVSINKEQRALLIEAIKSEEGKEQATLALDESKESDINLAKLIATVNEQESLDLPNRISVTGIIPALSGNKIWIEKNSFTVNEQTVIITSLGEITTDLTAIKGKVTVIGTRENNILIAKKIVIIDSEETSTPNPTVKGVTLPSATTPNVKTAPLEPTVPQDQTQPVTEQEAQGGFIFEPSDSQY